MKASAIRFVLISLLIAAFLILLSTAGPYLVRTDLPKNSSTALILMGSIPDRVLATIELWKQGKIKEVLIVEENMLGLSFFREKGYDIHTNSEQVASILVQAGLPDSLITIIPGMARSTLMEARALKAWLGEHQDKQVDTLLLISSAAHMRRAFMIFNHVLNHSSPSEIYIATYPSPYSGYNPKKWFTSKEDIQTTIAEYIKLISFQLAERWY